MDILDNLLQDGSCPFPEEHHGTVMEHIIAQMKEAYEGDPWFGRNARLLLNEVNSETAMVQPNGQHSILQLVWHMINWKEFALSRLQPGSEDLHYFEVNDWRQLDHQDASLWTKGKERLLELNNALLLALEGKKDSWLSEPVRERSYSNRKLMFGILQHDIYHLGQIAYVRKVVNGE